jgi:hypothetical protein
MSESVRDASEVIDRLVQATNDHDLAALVACFADDYVNETPAHPRRGFGGRDQVHRNWSQIFAGVPDIAASVVRRSVDGDTVWTEWDISGTRPDGAAFAMRGVVIFGIVGDTISTARFYLEPVEESSGNVDDHTRRVVGESAAPTAGVRS